MTRTHIELKVGIFVVLAVLILSMMVFQIGGINFFRPPVYLLYVTFDFVNGIDRDAPVHVAGVAVGKVTGVEIFFNNVENKTQVKLTLEVLKKVKLPVDSAAHINTLGILGEKYVEIVPGDERENLLENKGFLEGKNPVQLEKLTESLVDIVGDQTVKTSLRESFYNIRVATDNLREVSEKLNRIADAATDGNGTVGRMLNDDSIYVEAESMVSNLNVKLDKMVTDLNQSLNDLILDIKLRPWRLLQRPPSRDTSEDNRGFLFKKE